MAVLDGESHRGAVAPSCSVSPQLERATVGLRTVVAPSSLELLQLALPMVILGGILVTTEDCP